MRKVLHKCIDCFRSRPVSVQQLMGDLPENRVTCSRAFLNGGIDYGRLYLKLNRNKTCKAYICLFEHLCMSTKAIHLEPVSDLSTLGFIKSLNDSLLVKESMRTFILTTAATSKARIMICMRYMISWLNNLINRTLIIFALNKQSSGTLFPSHGWTMGDENQVCKNALA